MYDWIGLVIAAFVGPVFVLFIQRWLRNQELVEKTEQNRRAAWESEVNRALRRIDCNFAALRAKGHDVELEQEL